MPSEGDIIVAQLPQADGSSKLRPILLLRILPGYGDFLACGISSQIHQAVAGLDVILSEEAPYFPDTGLRVSSLVRLTFVAVVPCDRMQRRLGTVPKTILQNLQANLADHLVAGHEDMTRKGTTQKP